MSLTKFNGNTNNIQSLPNKPTQTAPQLKELFDKTGDEIKNYINGTLTEEIDTKFSDIDPKVADSGWLVLTVQNPATKGLTSPSYIYYRKIGKIIEIQGALVTLQNGNRVAPTTIIETLPSGYRPVRNMNVICSVGNYKSYKLTITTGGEIMAYSSEAGGYMPYDTAFRIECMYMN